MEFDRYLFRVAKAGASNPRPRAATHIFSLRQAGTHRNRCPDDPVKEETTMPKAYLVTTYRSIKKPEALAAYAKIAAPAI